jgi:hypothetical protein
VRNANGQKLAYVYFEDEPGRQAAAKLLSKDEERYTIYLLARVWTGRSSWPWSLAT